MSRYRLRFRQVHLDFHTSPQIPGIGEAFDKKQWQDSLRKGHVNSITCFSKCHHGVSYHPTKVGQTHPNLSFDLLRAQFDASKEIGVNVPIYLSAGVDNVASVAHPEWREVDVTGSYCGWTVDIAKPGFHAMCFNTPYLDYLCEQIREVARAYPDCDGIFLDIIMQSECCCKWCLAYMDDHGLDATKSEDRKKCALAAMEKYYVQTTAASRCDNPDMPVFHNSGHVSKDRKDLLKYFSHLELESLPTGGWGYDHFPLSAKYCNNLDLDYLGMTGKFHTTWGEFGGYKHPNALRYECAAMLAFGSKCSIGDQMHPSGHMDDSTYAIVGTAYSEVEAKEAWCDDVANVADIAVISPESENGKRNGNAESGVGRVLLEKHYLFDLIDRQGDFAKYRLLILPDEILVDDELKCKIDSFLLSGGKLLLTGKSGLKTDKSGFAFDIGANWAGESPWQPDYLEAGAELSIPHVSSPLVMYMKSQQVKATDGQVLAKIRQPYFNRTWKHFCSHQHAPYAAESEFSAAVRKGHILYLAHPVFSLYNVMGAVAYKNYADAAVRCLLGDGSLITNLPSTARVSMMEQPHENRYVLHLLYATKILEGADYVLSEEDYVSPSKTVEVIEDLLPLRDTSVRLRTPKPIKRVTLEPQGKEIEFRMADGLVELEVDEFTCHQMVVLHY